MTAEKINFHPLMACGHAANAIDSNGDPLKWR